MGCGESKHAVSTQNSTVNQSKRLNSKKNAEENVTGGGGDGNAVIVKESDDGLKVVSRTEKVDQILQKERGDDQNVKDGRDKEASLPPPPAVGNGDGNVKEAEKVDQIVLEKQIDQPKKESMVENEKEAEDKEASLPPPPPPPPAVVAVANGDDNVKEVEKVDQVVLEKQIDQPKEESMAENVKEADDKEASPPPDAAAAKAVVSVDDEAKGGEDKKELKEENPTEPKMEDARILAQPTDTDASEEKKDSGEVKEPTKEIETHQGAKNDKDLENQKEANIETGKAEAVESAEAKDSAQNDADEEIPTAKGEIEVESAAEAEKKAD